MVFPWSGSWLFQKVSKYFFHCMNKSLISNYSELWTWWLERIPGIQSNHLPHIAKPHPTDIEGRNGQTSVVTLCRWLLSVDYIWFGPIHCGLPRTSPVGLHSSRLVPQVSTYHRYMGLLMYRVRCTALNSDLDGKVGGWCSHEHTEAFMDALDEKVLWVDYGIISSIMVHPILFPQFFFWCNSKPFTHGFPHADIHELLSPNILHQMIKGTFKDHLVAWVVSYIKLVNTPKHAKMVLADIDRQYISQYMEF